MWGYYGCRQHDRNTRGDRLANVRTPGIVWVPMGILQQSLGSRVRSTHTVNTLAPKPGRRQIAELVYISSQVNFRIMSVPRNVFRQHASRGGMGKKLAALAALPPPKR